jgi:probable F420-dependent oxidoreductase
MKFGVYGINVGPCSDPEIAARVAQAAEESGFDSVWTGEHVVLPDPQVPPSPVPPGFPMLDPAVALGFVAAHTRNLRLGTGIIILPQRNPLVLAKALASLDVLSKGRLVFGIGVGYLKPEFDALGVPFDHKGERTDEYLEAILAIWTQEKPEYQGRFVDFKGIDARPRPLQKPHPPVVVGGQSPGAFRRAVRRANGWYGFMLDLKNTARFLQSLRDAGRREERPEALGELEISITPPMPLDRDTVRRYADLGVHRLIPLPLVRSGEEVVDWVRKTGEGVGAGSR